MTKVDFLKRVKLLSAAQSQRFGYPYLPLGLVREELGLSPQELPKLVSKALSEGAIAMTPVPESVRHQLPSALETLVLEDQTYVSLSVLGG